MTLLTSCSADFRSTPSRNSTITSDTPWLAVDCTVSAPETPCIAFDTGTPTCASTISGEAPGYGVMTITAGTEISGSRSCWTWVAA